jgi:transposase
MPARFVLVDHDTPMLLPPDLRHWVPEGHMVHFVMEAVEGLDLSAARINERGSGDQQYPPKMMLGLLIYSYATGTFSSRQIERQTYDSVAVRYLCADTHPDHDTICAFRRRHKELLESCFHEVLEIAARLKVLKVGDITVAIDGTKVLANASKHSAMSEGYAAGQMVLLEEQIAQLVAKAENADSTPLKDGLNVPEEVTRRQDRKAQIQAARNLMKERAKERFERERAEYESKLAERQAKEAATGKKPRGREPKAPQEGPGEQDQINFTDPQSRIMKAGSGEHFEQCYNAQAGVDIHSRLIVGARVSDAPNDKQQLVPDMGAISPVVESVKAVLVDSGYYSEEAVRAVEGSEGSVGQPVVYAAVGRQPHGSSVEQLECRPEPEPPPAGASMKEIMTYRLQTSAGRELYKQRKQTVEPVFGIIKEALGFRRFLLRGLEKVSLEWTLMCMSYNLKRLFHMNANIKMA